LLKKHLDDILYLPEVMSQNPIRISQFNLQVQHEIDDKLREIQQEEEIIFFDDLRLSERKPRNPKNWEGAFNEVSITQIEVPETDYF
jgi:hypothetical protein